jgi:hypothetical protein
MARGRELQNLDGQRPRDDAVRSAKRALALTV